MTTGENAFKYVNTKATLSYLVESIGSLAKKCTKWRNLCITVVTRRLTHLIQNPYQPIWPILKKSYISRVNKIMLLLYLHILLHLRSPKKKVFRQFLPRDYVRILAF